MTEGKKKTEMSFVGISLLLQKLHTPCHCDTLENRESSTYTGSSKRGKLNGGGALSG